MSVTADTPFLIIEADVSRPVDLGHTGAGARRVIPITGGRVSASWRARFWAAAPTGR